jgi:hypothetical protein
MSSSRRVCRTLIDKPQPNGSNYYTNI